MHRAFLSLPYGQLHLRSAGQGPPVVMLHPSPLSSRFLAPLAMAIAAAGYRVHALDTPGYGQSDPPARRPDSLEAYLPLIADALTSLGIERCCLYGAATGAQLAIEFAKRYPERVAVAVLDTVGDIPAQDCEQIIEGYFPGIAPRSDGAHLATLWHMVRELNVHFPWSACAPERRIERALPPASFMQSMLLDYLRAGERYDWAYRPAFRNERAERAFEVRVPTLLTRWEGSIALAITDALIAAGPPANFHIVPLGASAAERAVGLAAAISAHYPRSGSPAPQPASSTTLGTMQSRYIPIGDGQVHARVRAFGDGRPVVAMHASAGSAGAAERRHDLFPHRPFIAIDLPGSGESDPLFVDAELSIERYASVVAEVLDALGIAGADVVGRYGGAAVGAELARQRPALVASLAVDGRPADPPTDPAQYASRYAPDLGPRDDGTHLFAAWTMLRDQALWSPWFERTPDRRVDNYPELAPDALHRRLVDLMKCGARYRHAYAALFQYPFPSRVATLTCPVGDYRSSE